MNMLEFYRNILNAAGLENRQTVLQVPTLSNEGDITVENVWITISDPSVPLTIDNKAVVLPNRDLLRAGVPDSVIAFHPVCESPVRKDSAVFLRLQKCIMYRMNLVTAQLLSGLAEFAANTDKHKLASPEQMDFLQVVPQADAKTAKMIGDIMKKLQLENPTDRLISINTRRNAVTESRSHARGCLVQFPINEFRTKKDTILGVKPPRPRDVGIFYEILDFVFPDSTVLNAYSAYSDDLKAPSLHALLSATAKVYSRINSIVKIFADQLTDAQSMLTDLSYLAGMEFLSKYRTEVGELPGNIGDPIETNPNEIKTDGIQKDRFAIPQDVTRPKAPTPAPTAGVAASVVAPMKQAEPVKSVAASIVGALPAQKTPSAPTRTWADIQEENNRIQAMVNPQPQQPQVVYAQPQQYGYAQAPQPQVMYAQPQPQQQMVTVVDPNTGQQYLMPVQQMQPQVAAYQQPMVYQQPQMAMQPNNNGFAAYGPAPQQQMAYAQPQAYGGYVQQPMSPGRAAAMSNRAYGNRRY